MTVPGMVWPLLIVEGMLDRRGIALTTLAALASTAAFAGVLTTGGSPHLATLLRLAIATPILYLVLNRTHDTLRAALAIGAATGAKLMIEPLLVTLLSGQEAWGLVPLASDLGYGALITYVMLRTSTTTLEPAT